MTIPNPDDDQEPTDELSDEKLRSDEARRLRHRLRDTEGIAAEQVKLTADANARADAAERIAVNAELRGHFADPEDFWSRTELSQLHGDDGTLDVGLIHQHRDQQLHDHPQYRAVPVHNVAPAETVNASGKIGFGPISVLDGDNAEPQPVRNFAQFLNDAKNAVQPQ